MILNSGSSSLAPLRLYHGCIPFSGRQENRKVPNYLNFIFISSNKIIKDIKLFQIQVQTILSPFFQFVLVLTSPDRALGPAWCRPVSAPKAVWQSARSKTESRSKEENIASKMSPKSYIFRKNPKGIRSGTVLPARR